MPTSVKVNPTVVPYKFENYAATVNGVVPEADTPDWYWEVFFPTNLV